MQTQLPVDSQVSAQLRCPGELSLDGVSSSFACSCALRSIHQQLWIVSGDKDLRIRVGESPGFEGFSIFACPHGLRISTPLRRQALFLFQLDFETDDARRVPDLSSINQV